jgi:TRAP transporter TAXI family solute receptor
MYESHVRRGLRVLALLALFAWTGAALAAAQFKVVTADPKGTYYAIGKDLAKFVAPEADISLEVLPTAGSAANLKHLRYDPGVKFAIVQADVFQAFVDRAATGNAAAREVIHPLRVILPLYNTEIHFIVRADSPMNYLHDMEKAKINGGILGSGAALITQTVYRMLFNKPMPEAQASYVTNRDALVKLVKDKTVDVVVVAAGQPAPLIVNMQPEAQKYIKLLKFDPKHAASKEVLKVYASSVVRASSYPNLIKEDFNTVAVGAFLTTFNFGDQYTAGYLTRFARALCRNFPTLRQQGHPKWREVNLSFPQLAKGWDYYAPTTNEIRACLNNPVTGEAAKGGRQCSAEERILGLCN